MRTHTLVLLLLVSSSWAQSSLTTTDTSLVLETQMIRRQIHTSSTTPSPIMSTFFSKETGRLVLSTAGTSWFSFNVDHYSIVSSDPVWLLTGTNQRQMLNGGTEYSFTWKYSSGTLNGLLLTLLVQVYPDDDFFREKLVLGAIEGRLFHLTHAGGKPHCTVGAYSLPLTPTDRIIVEELRMATWNGQLIPTDYSSSFDARVLERDWRRGRNLEQNYMYHPQRVYYQATDAIPDFLKGPFVVIHNTTQGNGLWLAYEHGSEDNDTGENPVSIQVKREPAQIVTSISLNNGVHLNQQSISGSSRFSSLWHCYDFFQSTSIQDADQRIWQYLYKYICEISDSRKPLYYYNTWGMQRDESMRGNDIRGILTEEKVRQEIHHAAELGIDLFVLDDGWQERWGDWNVHLGRFPHGLQFYIDELTTRRIMPGLWIAPLATDSDAVITLQHPEWLIRDESGAPVVNQWQRRFFCFKSDFRKYFVELSKRLIDLGIRYFKWDGINALPCSSLLHGHGTEIHSAADRSAAQRYSLPLEITDAIRELKEHQPDLIVEIDVTEPHRNVGLAYLSEARYFWMNNGASWYGDYSTYRAKSMRMITNLFGSFMPTTLQTYANFPMYDPVYKAQRYNVNSSLIGGRGFWGNVARMMPDERSRVGHLVRKVHTVERVTAQVRPHIEGKVGSSPEVYRYIDTVTCSGKVVVFSGSALQLNHTVTIKRPSRLLGVLNNSYDVSGDSLVLHFEFTSPDDSREALLIPTERQGGRIISSTCWLDTLSAPGPGRLQYRNGAPGTQRILWPLTEGHPDIQSDKPISSSSVFNETTRSYVLSVTTSHSNTHVTLVGRARR